MKSAFDGFTTSTAQDGQVTRRQVIFVGHDMANEDKYLEMIGFSMSDKNIILRIDTKDVHQHLRDGDNGRALWHVLLDVGLDYRNLHNAGNDATYTLRAALACAMEDMRKQQALKDGTAVDSVYAVDEDEEDEEPHQYCI